MKYILRKCTVLLMAAALAVGSAGCVFAADVSCRSMLAERRTGRVCICKMD